MTDSADAMRAEIERTQAELGSDVDALVDKVTPSKIAHRQANKVRGAFTSLRERVMGVADDAGSAASGVAHGASGMVHDAASGVGDMAHEVKAKAQGAPLAVGLIAFGAGLLIASLIPASTKEKEVAEKVKEQAQPLVDKAAEVGKEVASDLKAPAQDAASAVMDRATEAKDHVTQEAQSATADVKDRAGEARENISGA